LVCVFLQLPPPPPPFPSFITRHPLQRFIEFPLDTIKTRLQTAHLAALAARVSGGAGAPPPPSAPLAALESPLQCLRTTLAKEGVRGLYRGCVTPCMGAAVEDSISFSVYHAVGRALAAPRAAGRPFRPEDLPLSKVFLAGSCGGMSTSFLVTPLELIKCRLQVDRVETGKRAGARYKGPLDCLVQSVRAEGLRVLYRGHSATFVREAVGTGSWFTTYEFGLRTLAPGRPRDQLPPYTVLLAGAVSGMALNGIPYPFDTAKSVLQTLQGAPGGADAGGLKGAPKTLLQAMRLIVDTQGVAGLYRGLTPALLRAMPANAAVFLVVRWRARGGFARAPQLRAAVRLTQMRAPSPTPTPPPPPPPHTHIHVRAQYETLHRVLKDWV
jgi:hypothetical protein